jgi:superfamily II DNA/RNA helicase
MSQSFDDFDLNPALSRALAEMGFTRPTTIQQMVLEPALDGRDILASAPTGTGKTAAFLLPAMQHLLDFPRPSRVRAACLILTRPASSRCGECSRRPWRCTPISASRPSSVASAMKSSCLH